MGQTLLSLPLRNKRDAMIARQRTRQLAGLLGFDAQEQASISANVFALAWQIVSLRSPVELFFRLEEEKLKVQVQARRKRSSDETSETARSVVCLERFLPGRSKVSVEDLGWAIDHLDQITPTQMYEEVYRINQELLTTMQALEACQAQLAVNKGEKPSAA